MWCFQIKKEEAKAGSEKAYCSSQKQTAVRWNTAIRSLTKDAEKKFAEKRRKIVKRAGITAAALVAVFGVSMTSDANRRYVLEAWNTVAGSLG